MGPNFVRAHPQRPAEVRLPETERVRNPYQFDQQRRGGCIAVILIFHQFSRRSPNISGLMPAFSDALMISIANDFLMGVGTFFPRIDDGIFWIT